MIGCTEKKKTCRLPTCCCAAELAACREISSAGIGKLQASSKLGRVLGLEKKMFKNGFIRDYFE